ncbi:akirin-2-like isoform X1 [Limulus polyphemus]|uniref:Akirin-2-like isoform X1 n=1 Tax=Limulus polyphemus TaxID=6850 RepID=A0ABM1B9T8_LIMPO|nr:akirin-2-like isoform X1 [Limulus polyphemus]
MACATLKRSNEWDPLSPNSERQTKRRRCVPVTLSSTIPSTSISSTTRTGETSPSPLKELSSDMTSGQVAANICEEKRHLQDRKQLYISMIEVSSSDSTRVPMGISSSFGQGLHSVTRKNQPLFTFRQVGFICERMMKERERKIKEEYDQVLNTKLAEQYDTFVKFTYDQMQRRLEAETPSYLS